MLFSEAQIVCFFKKKKIAKQFYGQQITNIKMYAFATTSCELAWVHCHWWVTCCLWHDEEEWYKYVTLWPDDS